MQTCSKCNEVKPFTAFNKDKHRKCGYKGKCRLCVKLYYKANRDSILAKCEEYRKANPDCTKKWRLQNPEYEKDRLKNNRGYFNAKSAKRRASKLLATPKWLTDFDNEYIKFVYNKASFLEMHVDHIVPLQGVNVCGLHVPWNLQLLEPSENIKKSNKF